MTKEEFKNLDVLNLNLYEYVNIAQMQDGKAAYKVKKGHTFVWCIEIKKNGNLVWIERYDAIRGQTYSKYGANHKCCVFESLHYLDRSMIENFDKIAEATDVLRHFGLEKKAR